MTAKPKRGGKRKGAGRQRIKGGTTSVHVTLDADTLAVMSKLGCGNVSAGVREAGRIVLESNRK